MTKIEWPTATAALAGPRRPRMPVVVGREVGVLGAAGGLGGLDQGGAQPLGAVAGASGAVFAGGLVVAGAHAGPRGEVPGGREAGHVGADLGEDHLGGPYATPGIPTSSCTAASWGSGARRSVRSARRSWRRLVDAGEHRRAQQGVMVVEPAGERVGELGDLRRASGPWPCRPAPPGRVRRRSARRSSPAPTWSAPTRRPRRA